MRGSDIFLTTPEDAPRWEGTWNGPGTILPGCCVEIVPGIIPSQGRFAFQPYCLTVGADGDPRAIMILDFDYLQGFTATSPIAVGQRCFVRFPLVGHECNIVLASQPGTGSANAFTQGERLMFQHATGQLIPQTSSSGLSPFMALEHIDELPPDTPTLVWCLRT